MGMPRPQTSYCVSHVLGLPGAVVTRVRITSILLLLLFAVTFPQESASGVDANVDGIQAGAYRVRVRFVVHESVYSLFQPSSAGPIGLGVTLDRVTGRALALANDYLLQAGFFTELAAIEPAPSDGEIDAAVLEGDIEKTLYRVRKIVPPSAAADVIVFLTSARSAAYAGLTWRASSCVAPHAAYSVVNLKGLSAVPFASFSSALAHELLHFLGARDRVDEDGLAPTIMNATATSAAPVLHPQTIQEILDHAGPGQAGSACLALFPSFPGTLEEESPGKPGFSDSRAIIARTEGEVLDHTFPVSIAGIPLFSASGLPPGFTLDPSTGRLFGIVSKANVGQRQVTITVRDLLFPGVPPDERQVVLELSRKADSLRGPSGVVELVPGKSEIISLSEDGSSSVMSWCSFPAKPRNVQLWSPGEGRARVRFSLRYKGPRRGTLCFTDGKGSFQRVRFHLRPRT